MTIPTKPCKTCGEPCLLDYCATCDDLAWRELRCREAGDVEGLAAVAQERMRRAGIVLEPRDEAQA